MNNYNAKFEYKGMKMFGVTNFTNYEPMDGCSDIKMSKFNSPQNKIIFMKEVYQYVNNHYKKFEYKRKKTF